MCAVKLADPSALSVAELRRLFGGIHDRLRNEGRNPVEAIALLASSLASDDGDNPAGGARTLLGSVPVDSICGHAASVAFQELLAEDARHGLGQYLTPLPVADLIAVVSAQKQPRTVLDPFAGSAILLERLHHRCPSARFLGIEINPAISAVARAVMALAGDGASIRSADVFVDWSRGTLDTVDAVVTNPPFGAAVTEAGRAALSEKAPSSLMKLRRLPAELAGLELAIQVLNEGGLLAIVLPQSVLTNASWAAYRRDVFTRIRPLAVVSLPEATFAPFRGVAKACVLFATRESHVLPARFRFIRSQSIGWDDTGRSVGDCDLPRIADDILCGEGTQLATIDEEGLFTNRAPDSFGDTHALGSIADVFIGRTLSRDGYTETGPRLLKVGDLEGAFVRWDVRARTCIPEGFYWKHPNHHLRVGDVCLTATAHRPRYIGLKVDLIDHVPHEGAMPSAEVLVIRLRPNSPLTPEQLLYYLRSRMGYLQLQDLVRGSTAHIYPKDVARLAIPALEKAPEAAGIIDAFWDAAHAFRRYMSLEASATELASRSVGALSRKDSDPADQD
jgi:type I restriction enzyme M protein